MSLDQLRTLRRNGQRPESINVLIGPARFDDGPGVVQILDAPHALDLRPVIGLPAHIIDLQDDPSRTRAVLDALQALNVQPLGFAGPAGTWGASPEHEYAIERYRSAVCKS